MSRTIGLGKDFIKIFSDRLNFSIIGLFFDRFQFVADLRIQSNHFECILRVGGIYHKFHGIMKIYQRYRK